MAKTILTYDQSKLLQILAQSPIAREFYLSGGTALSEYYLQHRLSEDLDFFRDQEFEITSILSVIKSLQSRIGYKTIDIQTSFNRNLLHLKLPQSTLKLEFTYYPFNQIEPPQFINGIQVDSLTDIAANKLFTISQKPRGRDYFDLFAIIQHEPRLDIPKLRLMAKQKFDWHIDPLQLGTQLNRASELLADPILTKDIKLLEITRFFTAQAQQLKPDILEE